MRSEDIVAILARTVADLSEAGFDGQASLEFSSSKPKTGGGRIRIINPTDRKTDCNLVVHVADGKLSATTAR